jgi:hypothetical protein
MNQDEHNEKIEEYGRGFDLLTAALAEVPQEAWEFKPALDEWSIHEIVVHMKDSESMGVMRLHKLIAEPGSTLMAYEESKWADALNYQNQDVEDALQIFKLTRRTTYRLLKTLPDQVFMQSVVHPEVVHPEYGESYTLEKWLNIYTRHIPEHIEQLQKTYQAWKEQN